MAPTAADPLDNLHSGRRDALLNAPRKLPARRWAARLDPTATHVTAAEEGAADAEETAARVCEEARDSAGRIRGIRLQGRRAPKASQRRARRDSDIVSSTSSTSIYTLKPSAPSINNIHFILSSPSSSCLPVRTVRVQYPLGWLPVLVFLFLKRASVKSKASQGQKRRSRPRHRVNTHPPFSIRKHPHM